MLLLGKLFKEAQACARRVLIVDPKNIEAQVLNANALAGMAEERFGRGVRDRWVIGRWEKRGTPMR